MSQLIATASGVGLESVRNQFDKMPIGCLVINLEGGIEYYNNNAATLLGFEEEYELGRINVGELEVVLDCGFFEAKSAILKGEIYRKIEHKCTNRKGQYKILNIHCHPYRDNSGEIVGVISTLQDVSESSFKKQELEEAIYELSIMSQVSEALSSSAELDEIFKVVLTGVTSSQGLGFNRAFLFLADENKTYLEGRLAVGPTSPEDAGRIWSHLDSKRLTLRQMLDTGQYGNANQDFPLTELIDGWQIPLTAKNIFGAAVTSGKALLIIRSDALGNESQKIISRLGTENLALAPIISKGRRLGLIAADNQITGREISPSVVELLQNFACQMAVAIERSKLYDNQVERAEELARMNEQLAASQEQIIRVEKMSVIGELTSSIAHELRNPLTVIGGFANLLLTNGPSEGNNEYLNIILSETKRAESVLHQVLDFSKASRTENRSINFCKLVGNCRDLVSSRLKRSQPKIKMNEPESSCNVWGNSDQLRHAIVQFLNIILEGLTDNCSVVLNVENTDSFVDLSMQIESDKKDRRKIIKMLGQAFNNPSGTQRLSVLVAGETIRYHGGNFGLEGSPEEPPKIRIELPVYKGQQYE